MKGSLKFAATAALVLAAASPGWLAAQAPPAGATFKCGDGTYSTAATARGACSRHGGVAQALTHAAAPAARAPAAAAQAAAPAARAPAAAAQAAAPAGATFKCVDGTYSTAATPRGACSRHGGVAQALRGAAAAAPAAAAPAAPAQTAPTPAPRAAAPRTAAPPAGAPANATALCKDGTYSMSQHRGGTCSRHGGVDRWLKEVPN